MVNALCERRTRRKLHDDRAMIGRSDVVSAGRNQTIDVPAIARQASRRSHSQACCMKGKPFSVFDELRAQQCMHAEPCCMNKVALLGSDKPWERHFRYRLPCRRCAEPIPEAAQPAPTGWAACLTRPRDRARCQTCVISQFPASVQSRTSSCFLECSATIAHDILYDAGHDVHPARRYTPHRAHWERARCAGGHQSGAPSSCRLGFPAHPTDAGWTGEPGLRHL